MDGESIMEGNHFEHILYEINMYIDTYLIHIPDNIANKQLYTNLVVESRAIHLRNLGEFFREKKEGKNWHYSDFVNSTNIHVINKELFGKIKRYTSQASCHLTDERIRKDFKKETSDCTKEAFGEIVLSIDSFFRALETNIKKEYIKEWENDDIQTRVQMTRLKLMPTLQYKYQYICYTTE